MARIDSLINCFTDIANAVREKKGTTDKIPVSDFDTEIINLPSGGDTPTKGFIVNEWTDDGYPKEITTIGLEILPYYYLFGGSTVNNHAYFTRHLKKVTLNDELKTLKGYSCYYNLVLEELVLPDTIELVENYAFAYSTITKLDFKNSPVVFVNNSMRQTNLIQVSGNNIQQLNGSAVGNGAFYGSNKLKAIWIGSSITKTTANVFIACTNLQKIYINLPRATVETLAGYSYAFMNDNTKTDIVVCNDDEGFITKEEFDAIDWGTV